MPQSAVTLQNFVDNAEDFGDLAPVLNVGGHSLEPALTAMNDAMNRFFADYPYKFNQINLPFFYTNSWQQDYVLINPNGSSVTNLSWLQQGIAVQINSTALGKPWTWVQVGRSQIQSTANLGSGLAANALAPIYSATYMPNNLLYYGTWGDTNTGNATLGNNPVAGSVYTNPLGQISQPANPITQIIDANNNYLVVTGYGTEGTTAPLAPVDAAVGTTATPGSGATTVWTVIDPYGQGIRITPVPSQVGTVWQFRLVGQMPPPRFTNFSQTIFPVIDEYEPHLRALFIAELYGYSSEAKIAAKAETKRQKALESLAKARQKSDRERDFYKFIAGTSVRSGGNNAGNGYVGPYWPYGGPPR
jgi:hypothetical protein